MNENEGKLMLDIMKKLVTHMASIEKKVDELLLVNGIIPNQKDAEITYTPIFKDKKALIGNYDYFSSEQTKKILESFGMNVDVVKTSIALMDKIKSGEKYDVIFTNNIYQIGITGPELLKELKSIPGFNTPVVIHTIDKDKRSYFVNELGFDEYITKPIYATDENKISEIKDILQKLL